MSWAKIDDQLHSNEKVLDCSLAARGLWLMCLSWVADKETDGAVSRPIVKLHAGVQWEELSGELVASGLWDVTETGWLFHDYLDCNPSRSELEEERRKTAERKARWKEKNASGTAEERVPNAGQTKMERVPNGGRTAEERVIPEPEPEPGVTKVTLSTPLPPQGDCAEDEGVESDSEPFEAPSDPFEAPSDPFAPEELHSDPPPPSRRMSQSEARRRDQSRTAIMAAFRHARYGKPLTDPIIASEFDKMRKPADDLIAGSITPEQVITATEAALSRWSDPTRVTLSSVASWITDLLAPRSTPNSAAPAQRPPESYRAYRSPEEIAESQARARALMEEVEGQRKIRAAAHAAKLKAEEEAKALSLAIGAYS